MMVKSARFDIKKKVATPGRAFSDSFPPCSPSETADSVGVGPRGCV
jgi:hypothetical protein